MSTRQKKKKLCNMTQLQNDIVLHSKKTHFIILINVKKLKFSYDLSSCYYSK